ncbi:MAG: MFS transporter [Patescibacteria group bacterium]|nr:MFS transporter [Patescibacteria group bacterium]
MKKSWLSLIFPKTHFSSDIIALYSQRLIQGLAIGLLGLFLPIFLYEKLNFSLSAVMLYYFLTWLAYLFLVQPGARLMSKFGLKLSMMLSVPFLALFYLALYFVDVGNAWSFLIMSIIAATVWRMLYWVPYHTEFAEFTDRANRGKQIGFLESITALIGVLAPVLSGFIIAKFGYQSLIVMVIILVVVSMFPLIFTRSVKENYSYGYFETFRRLFTKHRRLLYAYGAEGAENAIGLVIWPLFIYEVLKGNYLDIGAISALIIFATIVLRLLTGKYTDQMPKRRLLNLGTLIYSVGWILKVFVETGYQIFLVSTYHNLAQSVMRTPFDAMTYERMADAGHYVDEMTVFREMSLNLGKALMYLVLLILVGIVSLKSIFWFAAIFSLFMNLI